MPNGTRNLKASQSLCECADSGCPMHLGTDCDSSESENLTILYRVDMTDYTGTRFCDGCADDAFESGLFCTDRDLADSQDDDEESEAR